MCVCVCLCVCVCVFVRVCVCVCVPLVNDTKGFLFLAWVPLVLAIAIYFHHQCFLVRSRTDHEELSLSIWSDVSFFSFAYFTTFLIFRSAIAAMTSFSVLLRAYSSKFCLSSLTQSSILTTSLPSSLLQSSAGYLEQNGEIQWNWTGQGKFDIYFCVFFDCYSRSLVSERETGR